MSASNIYNFKGNLNGEKTINFPIPVRYLAITNTSGSAELDWKFKESQTSETLEPTEITTMDDINVYTVILNTTNGSYRIRGRG